MSSSNTVHILIPTTRLFRKEHTNYLTQIESIIKNLFEFPEERRLEKLYARGEPAEVISIPGTACRRPLYGIC